MDDTIKRIFLEGRHHNIGAIIAMQYGIECSGYLELGKMPVTTNGYKGYPTASNLVHYRDYLKFATMVKPSKKNQS